MVFDEKVDVIDLIINVLKDHEKTLDGLISKLEEVLAGAVSMPSAVRRTEVGRPAFSVVLRSWDDFMERCYNVGLVAFDVEGKLFKVSAVKDGVHYTYQEEMPDMEIRFRENEQKAVINEIGVSDPGLIPTVIRGALKCGLRVSVKGAEVKLPDGGAVYKVVYDIDTDEASSWLSEQLKVDKKRVLQGKIQI